MSEPTPTLESLCARLSEDSRKATYLKKFIEIAAFSESEEEKDHAIKNISSIRLKEYRLIKVFSLDNYLVAHFEMDNSSPEQSYVCEIPIEKRGKPYSLTINHS